MAALTALRKLQRSWSSLVQHLPLDPNLPSQLAASRMHVQAASGAMAMAQLKADVLDSGPLRLATLTTVACQRMVITLQPAYLAIGLIQQGVITTETDNQRRLSKQNGQLLYLMGPNQSVALHFQSPSAKWHQLCISAQALASSCQSIGLKAPPWGQLRPPLEQSCELLNTLVRQLQTEPQPEASAQMILLHLASRCAQASPPRAANAPEHSRSEHLVQQALEFFQEHIHRPISLAEVSAFCGISARRLQSAFQTCRGCTPMEALLQERLKGLRNLLLGGVSVGDACRRVGLKSSGRVARLYLNQYGELPRETHSGKLTSLPDRMVSSESTA